MALTSLVGATFTDEYGHTARTGIHVPNTATVAQIQAYSDILMAAFDAISGGVISNASVNLALTLPGGLKSSPINGVDVRKGANSGFVVNASNYRHTIRVPGVLESLLNGDNINDADADYAAWLNAIIAGDGTLQAQNPFGLDLTAHIDSVATFRAK